MFWRFWRKPERQREIFCYFDGNKPRSADPIVVYRSLKDDPKFNIDVHPALVDAGDADAIGITAAAVRSAFGVKSLDAGGLTEQECISLLLQYFDWVDSVKKKDSQPLTLPPASDTTPPLECSATPTSSPSESTSTVTGPN